MLIGRQHHLEVSVGVDLEFVDQFVRGRRDAVHRLQPDVARGAAVAEQAVTLAAAQHGAGVDAVGALHSPGHGVVSAGGGDRQDRIRVEPQHLVDTGSEQHEQVPHPRGEIGPISIRRVGFHHPRGFAKPIQQMRPRRRRAGADVVGLTDRAASAIENGNHASGFGSLTFPRFRRRNESLTENDIFI